MHYETYSLQSKLTRFKVNCYNFYRYQNVSATPTRHHSVIFWQCASILPGLSENPALFFHSSKAIYSSAILGYEWPGRQWHGLPSLISDLSSATCAFRRGTCCPYILPLHWLSSLFKHTSGQNTLITRRRHELMEAWSFQVTLAVNFHVLL